MQHIIIIIIIIIIIAACPYIVQGKAVLLKYISERNIGYKNCNSYLRFTSIRVDALRLKS